MQVPSNAQRGRVKEKAKKGCGRASTLPTPYPIEYSLGTPLHIAPVRMDGWHMCGIQRCTAGVIKRTRKRQLRRELPAGQGNGNGR